MSFDVAAGSERLAGLDNVKVLGVNVVMLWKVVVLLCDEYTLAEEVLVNLLAVCLRDEPRGESVYQVHLFVLECNGLNGTYMLAVVEGKTVW